MLFMKRLKQPAMPKRYKLLAGFTLAEVLITLGIIGVIAALTIPTLVHNIQNAKYYSAFQKSYSTMSQLTETLVLENGDMAGAISAYGSLANAYKAKAKVMKFCPESPTDSGCMPVNISMIDNTPTLPEYYWYDCLVLADGMAMAIQTIADSCNYDFGGSFQNGCGTIYLDTNGISKPNQIGRDVFYFNITKDRLFPQGMPGTTMEWTPDNIWYCNPEITDPNSGTACASRLVQEGKMDY